jgi:hypothetical protein
MCIDKARMAGQVGNAALVEIVLVNAVQSLDICVPSLFEAGPVMPFNLDVEAIIGNMMETVRVMRCVPHDLLGHTPYVDTGATQRAVLDDGCFRAVFGRTLRMRESTAAATYYQKVVSFHHSLSP